MGLTPDRGMFRDLKDANRVEIRAVHTPFPSHLQVGSRHEVITDYYHIRTGVRSTAGLENPWATERSSER